MEVTIIGCSGSFPGPYAAASSYLVSHVATDGALWQVVFDLGSGAVGPLQRQVQPQALNAICLSHMHPDHCSDLWGAYVALKYAPTGPVTRRMPLYAPAGALDRLSQMFDVPAVELAEHFDHTIWQLGQAVTIGPLTVEPFAAVHPITAYSLRITGTRADGTKAVFTYSGDTDDCPGVRAAAQDADLFLAESSFESAVISARGVHLTGERAGQIATDCAAQRLVLTHIPPTNDPAVSLAAASSTYSGPVLLATPSARYVV